jgi:hypothetical protein
VDRDDFTIIKFKVYLTRQLPIMISVLWATLGYSQCIATDIIRKATGMVEIEGLPASDNVVIRTHDNG